MQLRVLKEHIIEGLQKAANILPSKTGAAYLRSIWLKAENGTLSIMATDSNIEFCGTYAVESKESGLVGVQGRAFVDLLRKLPTGEIVLQLDTEASILRIEQGRRKYKLPINDAVWFQNFSEFPSDDVVMWSGDFLQELIERTAFCISDEDSMEAISCLFIKPVEDNHIEACGLNGHQFAMWRFLHDELHAKLPQEGILIQKKYLGELKKWLGNDEIELNISNKRLYLRTGDGRETFSLPLSTYQYPDYRNFLNKLSMPGVSRLALSRKECMEALDRLQIFHSDNNRCTYFTLTDNEVLLSAQGQDVGSASESLEARYEGDIPKIAFPTRNLIDIMTHYQSNVLDCIFTGTEGPCGITGPDDPEYTVIVMPMKIVDETYYNEEEV